MSDAGNNNYLDTMAKANMLPYGVDFPNGNTGRFTNGKTVIDFIAEMLGLPFPPPYMSLTNAMRAKQITGVNYASASSGILPETASHVGKCLTLDQQVNLFERTVKEDLPKIFKHPTLVSRHIAKSIFTVWFGGNDYANNYLSDHYQSGKKYSPQRFGELLRDHLAEKLKVQTGPKELRTNLTINKVPRLVL
ncbi:GDSL esterase/lipase 7-like [Magnolia sinica]|uniref:GDSL esterase/lipase 7-like n=1 Tax=Magnolia sinica TaxID=86752 RepID=UPI00265B2745|nr:GDSL esterase/lipase 7-like [Magnolia sinica]